MKYFLVGYMACGKTHYGRELSEKMGMRFIDLDEYIVQREGRTITEIFIQKGEEGFRKMESRCLKEVCELYDSFVLSTGGGTPCFNDNMTYMNTQGDTIFLNVSVDIIVQRLIYGKAKRPLVSNLSNEEIYAFVEKHLAERLSYYSQAKHVYVPKINTNENGL